MKHGERVHPVVVRRIAVAFAHHQHEPKGERSRLSRSRMGRAQRAHLLSVSWLIGQQSFMPRSWKTATTAAGVRISSICRGTKWNSRKLLPILCMSKDSSWSSLSVSSLDTYRIPHRDVAEYRRWTEQRNTFMWYIINSLLRWLRC